MPFSELAALEAQGPLKIMLLHAGGEGSLTLAGLVQPLRVAAKLLGPGRLQLELVTLDAARFDGDRPRPHLALLVADEHDAQPLPAEQTRQLIRSCQQAAFWGAAGAAVLWLVQAGAMQGFRTALPWALYPEADDAAGSAILTPHLFEIDRNRITCCGGAASLDFALNLLHGLYGAALQSGVKEALCIERVRGPQERQRQALQARFGQLQPKLSEAVTLMEANIEEPLATDDIASLVGISRRQLERLFKQYLNSVPSRYYLELRLQKARQLLLDSNHSIVQIGLMCGFSSGSHFSTAFGALFGITPREERQRKLVAAAQ